MIGMVSGPSRLRLDAGCSNIARVFAFGALALISLCTLPATAQSAETATTLIESSTASTAPVVIDGRTLFRVRGVTAYPAEKRAKDIAARIVTFAADASRSTDTLRTVEAGPRSVILAGDTPLMSVLDEDSRIEGVNRQLLAHTDLAAIARAATDYRADRSRSRLIRDGLWTFAATAVAAVAALLLIRLLRLLAGLVERRYQRRIERIEAESFRLIRAEAIWRIAHGIVVTLGVLLAAIGFYSYLHFVLNLYPWTRGLAERLFALIIGSVGGIATNILLAIPDLIVIAVIIFSAGYLLKLSRLFFGAIGRGQIKLASFEAEWADPTLRLVRFLIVAFAAVISYPYIPGSQSAAFKGISIFLGVLFSLGSSSLIANLIAGYTMTYRRAFHLGDRIAIGNMIGDVTEVRLMVTHLRSPKNEELIIPNSVILAAEVTNFSSLAREKGLILHTTVAIGYEIPWRQVETMLLLGAGRTGGILTDPPPFVLQKALGEFFVTYELNVYCDQPLETDQLYTELHRSILDVFNEYGVQIMTPAYVADPAEPKIVPKERWFVAPAPTAHSVVNGDGKPGQAAAGSGAKRRARLSRSGSLPA